MRVWDCGCGMRFEMGHLVRLRWVTMCEKEGGGEILVCIGSGCVWCMYNVDVWVGGFMRDWVQRYKGVWVYRYVGIRVCVYGSVGIRVCVCVCVYRGCGTHTVGVCRM